MSSPLTPRLTFSLGLEEMEEEPGLYLGYPSGSPHLCGTPHGFSPCLATLARRKAQPGVPLSESLFLSPYLSLTLCLEEASWRGRMHFSFYFTYLESLSSFTKNQGDQAGMGVGEQGGPSPTSYSLFVCFFLCFLIFFLLFTSKRWKWVEDWGLEKGRKPECTEPSMRCSGVV